MIARLYILFFSLVLINNSAFAEGEKLKLKSDPPKANIYIRDINSSKNIKIGATPFEDNLSNLASTYAKSGFFIVTIEKEGFESQSIMLSNLFKSDLDMNLTLTAKEDFLVYRKIDRAINEIFEAQRLIRAQQYDDAITLLKNVEKNQENLSIVPEIIASAQYLKKDLKTSLVWYEKAYRKNPENKDAYVMKTYLRKALGLVSEK
jgi:tetratricopeptide (TPR) repeat protein